MLKYRKLRLQVRHESQSPSATEIGPPTHPLPSQYFPPKMSQDARVYHAQSPFPPRHQLSAGSADLTPPLASLTAAPFRSLRPSPKQTPQLLQPPLRILGLIPLPRHRQIRKRLLLILQHQHLLLKAVLHNKPLNRNLPILSKSVDTINSLGFSGRIELRLHHEDFVGGGQVEAQTAGADRDEHYADGRVGAEDAHAFVAGFARHAAVEADIGVAVVFESDFDEVEVRCPAGEHNAANSVSPLLVLVGCIHTS
jgi:hypothetical protein